MPQLLARLTGFETSEIDVCLRKLVQELEEIHVRGRERVDRAGRDLVLSWLEMPPGERAGEQLILVSVLPSRGPGRASMSPQIQVAPKLLPPDDHAVTLMRPRVAAAELDIDATVPRPRVQDGNALSFLAKGTPTFSHDVAKLQLEALAMAPRPFVPDATFSSREPAPAPSSPIAGLPIEEIHYVPAGAGRTFRRLPVTIDRPSSQDIDATVPRAKLEAADYEVVVSGGRSPSIDR
jgi:hypothetical protein